MPISKVKYLPNMIIILLGCFGLRVGYQLLYIHVLRFSSPFSDPFYEPSVDSYDEIAQNLLKGKGYSLPNNDRLAERRRVNWPEQPTAFRMPAYPLTLFLIHKTTGTGMMPALIMQAVFDTVTCYLIFLLAAGLFGDRRTSLLSALLWAVYLPGILLTRKLYSEPMFTMLLCGAVLLAVRAFQQKNAGYFGLAGAAFGLSALCRPVIMLFPFFWSVVMVAKERSGQALKRAFFILLGFAVVLAPWVIRNYRQFGRFIPGTTHFGYSFYAGNAALEDENCFKYLSIPMVYELIGEKVPLSLADPKHRDEAGLNRFLVKETLKLIRKFPGKYLLVCINRFFLLWFNQGLGRPVELKWVLFGLLSLAVIVSAAVGFKRVEAENESRRLVGLMIVFFTLIHMLVLARWRFTIPVLPYLLIFSSVGIMRVKDQ